MAQRSAIGKAAPPPQTEPGTARGLAKQVQVRPSISTMLWRNRPPFPRSIASFLTRLHLSSTAPTLSSTQKRTRFRPFLAFPGAFFSFSLFFGCKIFVLLFVHFVA